MTEEFRGLNTVRVSKEFLLKKLAENREIHKDTYEKARDAWHKKVIKTLETELKKVKADKLYSPNVYVQAPYSYESSYDKVIDILTASLDTEFILSSTEFSQYVRDEWQWKNSFITTVSGCYGE